MTAESGRQLHQQPSALAGPVLDAALIELGLSAVAPAIALFGNLGRALLFVAAARACGPFDGRPARPVSINALAASLGRPFETTRRNANWLATQGLLSRTETGLSVPLQVIADPRVAGFTDYCHDLLVRLIEELRAANLALPVARAGIGYDPRIGTGIALDLLLTSFESHSQRENNLTRLALLTAFQWVQWRHGQHSQGATSVKPSMIARLLGLPYATVARNIDLMVLQGVLMRTDNGVQIAPTATDAAMAVNARIAAANRARLLLGRLGQAGFPMEQPTLAYIRSRPPLPVLR